ncbi:Uncharacterized protein Rs2_07591 [Raphanus sativus]|nr:Uncharacterized protein Rs2_07591 [Raphanus sativus]
MSSSGEMLSTAGGVITRTRVTENGQEGKGQAILASENLTEVKKEKPLMVPSSFNDCCGGGLRMVLTGYGFCLVIITHPPKTRNTSLSLLCSERPIKIVTQI